VDIDIARLISISFDILSLTSILALLVLGMGVIVSMMRIFNLAHGELVLLGGYTVYVVNRWGASPWIGIILAPIVVGAIGVALERGLIRLFYERPISALLATWGIGVVLRELVRNGLGGLSRSVAAPLSGTLQVGGISFSQWRIVVIVVTLAVMLLASLLLQRTNIGLQVRATLENRTLARASGIRVDAIYAGTFGFGAALAGLAGAMVVPLVSLYAELGTTYLVRSFLAVMVGGIGSFEAPIGGAALIGVSSGALPWFVSPVLADVLVFGIAVALVRFRPHGLFGGRR
jgi:branched-chain amino acid transport system permease protein